MVNNILLGIFIISYIFLIIGLIKGLNPTIVLLLTGIFWAILGKYNLMGIVNDLVAGQLVNQSTAFMTIIFGSWFAQVLVQTGVVSTIIRTAVEIGGDNQKVLVAIIMLVVSALFTTLYSIGPVIAVGVIVLPVMISQGVKPRIAVAAYGLSVGVATLLNVSQYSVDRGLLSYITGIPETMGAPWMPFALIAFVIGVVINITGIVLMMHFSDNKRGKVKRVRSWAAKAAADDDEIKFVPWYVCVATVIPVLLMMAFKVNIFAAFIIGVLYAVITAKITYRRIRVFPMVSQTFKTGAAGAAGMIMYMVCAYVMASGAAAIRPILRETIGGFLPQTTLGISIFMLVLIPLFMYRGPLALAGAGAALYATISAVGAVPDAYLWMLCFVGARIHYGVDPTNSSNVWTCSYAKIKPTEFIKTVLPISWVFGAAIILLLYYMHG